MISSLKVTSYNKACQMAGAFGSSAIFFICLIFKDHPVASMRIPAENVSEVLGKTASQKKLHGPGSEGPNIEHGYFQHLSAPMITTTLANQDCSRPRGLGVDLNLPPPEEELYSPASEWGGNPSENPHFENHEKSPNQEIIHTSAHIENVVDKSHTRESVNSDKPNQKEILNSCKKRKFLLENGGKGSSRCGAAGWLREDKASSNEIQAFSSKSHQSNFENSERTPRKIKIKSVERIMRRLRATAAIHIQNLEILQNDIRLFFSKLEEFYASRVLMEFFEENWPEKNVETVYSSMENLVESFLGLVGASCDLEKIQLPFEKFQSSWLYVKAYLSSWIDEVKNVPQNKQKLVSEIPEDVVDELRPFGDYVTSMISKKHKIMVNICHQLWIGWLEKNKIAQFSFPFEESKIKLNAIGNGIEEFMNKEKFRSKSHETAQGLGSLNSSLIMGTRKEKLKTEECILKLVEEGSQLDKPLHVHRDNLESKVEQMNNFVFSKVKVSMAATQAKGKKAKKPILPKKYHLSLSTNPAFVETRLVKNLMEKVLPAFLGLVKRFNMKYGDKTQENIILESCLTFIGTLVSQWNKIEYVEMANAHFSKSIHGESNLSGEISGDIFWKAAFPDIPYHVSAELLSRLVQNWAKADSVPENDLKAYVVKHGLGLRATYYDLRGKSRLWPLFENGSAEQDPNKIRSARISDGSDVSISKVPNAEAMEG